MRVGLVFGGDTTEGEVSRSSASGVRGALAKLGYDVIDIEFDKNVAMHIIDANVDVVFNAMHGKYGEDGCLPGILDVMKIPYTHSGVLASAIAMNKKISKHIFSDIGIKVARDVIVLKEDLLNDTWKEKIKNSNLKDCKEFFVKPVCDGSSRDTYFIHDIEKYSFYGKQFQTASEEFLIEEKITGREMQVCVVEDKAIGVLEVIPNKEKSEFYDFNAKYNLDGAVHKMYKDNDDIRQKLLNYAERIHKTLHLKDVSRSEYLLTENNEIYALEVNSHPGLTPTSILPEVAFFAKNMSYDQLVEMLIKNAKYC